MIGRTEGEIRNDGQVYYYKNDTNPLSYYTNPIINNNLPDPSVIKSKGGYFFICYRRFEKRSYI